MQAIKQEKRTSAAKSCKRN